MALLPTPPPSPSPSPIHLYCLHRENYQNVDENSMIYKQIISGVCPRTHTAANEGKPHGWVWKGITVSVDSWVPVPVDISIMLLVSIHQVALRSTKYYILRPVNAQMVRAYHKVWQGWI